MRRPTTALLFIVALAVSMPAVAAEPRTVAGKTLDQWSRQLESRDRPSRLVAVVTLRQFGPDAVDPLLAAVASPDEGVRFWAVSTLGDFAADVRQRSQAPALVKLLDDLIAHDTTSVRLAAAYARCRLGTSQQALKILAEALSSEQRGVCVMAADDLAAIGPNAAGAIDALKKATGHADYHVADSARRALWAVQGESPPEN